MPLAPGSRLGPYEIVSAIGAGGMGEVWKARDTRLNRDVAIKTSHANFTERFERESRAIAALNHSNICQIYDVGPDYLVMEYVEGKPIAPVDTTRRLLDIAVQLADGLAAAHTAKIIHRDLKPDNILIAADGRIKILDFGLAKTTAELGPDNDVTRSIMLTAAGGTVGTIAYMSPEQARGNPNLTPQSDQFALGLILYELATGKRAFQRGSAAEIMTAIIREDCDPLPESLPEPLRWIIERLLSKEPSERYESTRDLYRELRQLRDRPSGSTTSAVAIPAMAPAEKPHAAAKKNSRIPLVAAGVTIALIAAAISWLAHPGSSAGRQHFSPMEVSWANPRNPVWSPDSKSFVYVAGNGKDRRVFLRLLNSPSATPLTRDTRDLQPVGWSPDGKRVILIGKNPKGDKPPNALFSFPVFGGEPELMMQMPEMKDISVSADGRALAIISQDEDGSIVVQTASPPGSPLKRYTRAPFKTANFINDPRAGFSPDGKSILLFVDVTGGKQVWKLPYPEGSAPERVLKNLPTRGGTPSFTWFPDASHGVIGLDDETGSRTHLWSVGVRSGSRSELTNGVSSEFSPLLSPDGTKLLFGQGQSDYMILSASLTDATVERVISSGVATGMPAWAPHQEKLIYVSNRNGEPAIWIRSDGWDRPVVATTAFAAGTTGWLMTPALSPGADRVIFTRVDTDQQVHDWISSVAGGSPVRLTNTKGIIEMGGAWSPDGTKFVYVQVHNKTASLMVAKTSGETEPVVLRENISGALPDWSPDGQWITFRDQQEQGRWSLISPDGKTLRRYDLPKTIQLTFSADSRLLYGIREDGDHRYLYSLDIATKAEKTIGDVGIDLTPGTYLNPGIRLSLSPDGKHIVYPAIKSSASLWMLEGFDTPGLTGKLRELLPF